MSEPHPFSNSAQTNDGRSSKQDSSRAEQTKPNPLGPKLKLNPKGVVVGELQGQNSNYVFSNSPPFHFHEKKSAFFQSQSREITLCQNATLVVDV